jgi:hypothetical protein
MGARPVVVGVDGSEESLRAVKWAALPGQAGGHCSHAASAPASLPDGPAAVRPPWHSRPPVPMPLRRIPVLPIPFLPARQGLPVLSLGYWAAVSQRNWASTLMPGTPR